MDHQQSSITFEANKSQEAIQKLGEADKIHRSSPDHSKAENSENNHFDSSSSTVLEAMQCSPMKATAAPLMTASSLLLGGLRRSPDEYSKLKFLRRSMVRHLETMLSQKGEHEGMPVNQLAEALERHLFKTAPSVRQYADVKTLRLRVQLLTVALLRRRLKQRQTPTRSETIKQCLGFEKFEEVSELVKTIKHMRLIHIADGCQTCNGNQSCSLSLNSSNKKGSEQRLTGQERIPVPVRLLFFEMAIVEAFENTPVERIPELPWDEMIQQAHTNIQIYQEWN